MFVASLSNIKMDCLGIRFYWLFICDRGPQSKSINQSAVAGSKFATNENIFCSFSVVFTLIQPVQAKVQYIVSLGSCSRVPALLFDFLFSLIGFRDPLFEVLQTLNFYM